MTSRVDRKGKPVWLTPVQADGKGFPDLVLVRGKRLIFAEVKAERGRGSPEQDAWFTALRSAGRGEGQYVYIWRPSNWDEIVEVLT